MKHNHLFLKQTNLLFMKNNLHRLLMVAYISISTTSLIQSQNNALNFDGVDDYVECGNRLPLSYTKEAWIYITNLSNPNNIISGDAGSPHAFWIPTAMLFAGHHHHLMGEKLHPMNYLLQP